MKKPQTVSQFAREFQLRKTFTPSLHLMEIKKLKDLKGVIQIMSN